MSFELYNSEKPNKRFMVKFVNPKTDRINHIHFGDSKMDNYTIHKDIERKENYLKRHKSREDWQNLYSAGAWSRWLLWNKPSLKSSIKDMEQIFNISINNNTNMKLGGILSKKIDKVLNQKPSAYRSMQLSKLGLTKNNKSNKNALENWRSEKWLNLNALLKGKKLPCGEKYDGQKTPTVCRPSIKINDKTSSPLTNELTKNQILKAINIKKTGKRIIWDEL